MATINSDTRANALTRTRLKSFLDDAMDLSEAPGGGSLNNADGYELNEDGKPVEAVTVALFKVADEMRSEIENLRQDLEDIHAYMKDAFGTDSDSAASQGPQGPAGSTGAKGVKGDTGAQGPQ